MIFYIYLYTNLVNNKKYVGQTNNFQRRVNEHKSCSFNPKSINYNDILHCAIRKYGYDNFNIQILETIIDAENYGIVNEREAYWIKEQKSLITEWGYNILDGGKNCQKTFLSQNQIQDIKNLIHIGTSYNEIQHKYPISKTFISDINYGKFFFDEAETYPLYAYRVSSEIYDALVEDLLKPELTFKQLGDRYGLAESTVKKFNYGTLRPGYYKGNYPIRKLTPQQYKRQLIKDYLLNTNLLYKDIAYLTQSSDETVRRVNTGAVDKDENLSYPLR